MRITRMYGYTWCFQSEVEKEPDGEDEEPSPKKPRTEKELPKNLKKLQGASAYRSTNLLVVWRVISSGTVACFGRCECN